LVRLSVGVEDARDLVEDLLQAFELATHPHVEDVRFLARHGSAAVLDAAASGGDGDVAAPPPASEPGAPGLAEITAMRRQLASLSERLELAEEAKREVRRELTEERDSSKRLLAGAWGVAFAASAVALALSALGWGRRTA
jgi:hypothetical protein